MIGTSIELVEEEIDSEFRKNGLMDIGYAQAVWTLLSVVEDQHLKHTYVRPLPYEQMYIFVDGLLNDLSHPMRALWETIQEPIGDLEKYLVDEHYGMATEWLEKTQIYNDFCSIFPLWHNRKVTLSVIGNTLLVQGWSFQNPEYEAYNRLVKKDGAKSENTIQELPSSLIPEIMSCVRSYEDSFDLILKSKLMHRLIAAISMASPQRHKLPDDWETTTFSFGDFKEVVVAVQAILRARFTARAILATEGMKGLGYKSGVWVITRDKLTAKLVRFTKVRKRSVEKILDYLTFGSNDIRAPDIVLQPIVDLKNGSVALSPFVWCHSDLERNFCVLLNQIPQEKKKYLDLVQEKEMIFRSEIFDHVKDRGYDIRYGKVRGTDLDVAIIDRVQKVCICLELKWFIEPAEMREVIQRSEELKKGVLQARKIIDLYKECDDDLMQRVLNIDGSYEFMAAVGSRNWIGFQDVQDELVPIIKVWHFLEMIDELGGLREAMTWLKSRSYLPKESIDFEIVPKDLPFGDWNSKWHGIRPLPSN